MSIKSSISENPTPCSTGSFRENSISKGETLSSLRKQVDALDSQILALLDQRAALNSSIRAAKEQDPSSQNKQAVVFRPGREAQVIQRLLQESNGQFPKWAMIQIWREIMTAMVRLQNDLSIAVPKNLKLRFLTRQHFGRSIPIEDYTNTKKALEAVSSGKRALAVITAEDLISFELFKEKKLFLVSRLPFWTADTLKADEQTSFIVAGSPCDFNPTVAYEKYFWSETPLTGAFQVAPQIWGQTLPSSDLGSDLETLEKTPEAFSKGILIGFGPAPLCKTKLDTSL